MTRSPDRPADASPAPPRARDRRVRSGPEGRERRRRIMRYAMLLISGALMVNALFGEKGYLATIQARQAHDQKESSLRQLRAENAQLADEAQRLRSDPKALEEAARGNLGMIRPGETLITIRDRVKD